MAIKGVSPDLVIGLFCFSSGLALVVMGFGFKKKSLRTRTPGGPTVMPLFAAGALFGVGGLWVLIFGFPGLA